MSENHSEQGPEMGDMGAVAGFEVTDEAISDFIGEEAPTFHPIMRVWREILAPAVAESDSKVTPQWASKMVATHPGLTYADTVVVHERYYAKILELASILESEIETDDECLNYTTPEEDVEHNSGHYRNLLACWQLAILDWELDWEATDPAAAAELAAISEVHKLFLGQMGVVAYLDNIKFVYTEADQAELHELIEERKQKAQA